MNFFYNKNYVVSTPLLSMRFVGNDTGEKNNSPKKKFISHVWNK